MPGPKELMALFRARRTIRLYTEEPVSREHLELILEAGRFAPSGGNRQPLQYIVVQTPERIRTIRRLAIDALLKMAREMEEALSRQEASGQPLPPSHQSLRVYIQVWKDLHELEKQGIDRLFYRAPALVVCHADTTDAPTPEVDAGIAAMQMVLMAETLGLGSCFCGFLVFAIKSSGQLLEALEIPKHHIVPFSFVVGHPDVEYLRTVARRPLRVRWM
jgi:nitroreductase